MHGRTHFSFNFKFLQFTLSDLRGDELVAERNALYSVADRGSVA